MLSALGRVLHTTPRPFPLLTLSWRPWHKSRGSMSTSLVQWKFRTGCGHCTLRVLPICAQPVQACCRWANTHSGTCSLGCAPVVLALNCISEASLGTLELPLKNSIDTASVSAIPKLPSDKPAGFSILKCTIPTKDKGNERQRSPLAVTASSLFPPQ